MAFFADSYGELNPGTDSVDRRVARQREPWTARRQVLTMLVLMVAGWGVVSGLGLSIYLLVDRLAG